jgi:translation initiation factor IF-2
MMIIKSMKDLGILQITIQAAPAGTGVKNKRTQASRTTPATPALKKHSQASPVNKRARPTPAPTAPAVPTPATPTGTALKKRARPTPAAPAVPAPTTPAVTTRSGRTSKQTEKAQQKY